MNMLDITGFVKAVFARMGAVITAAAEPAVFRLKSGALGAEAA